MSVFSLSIRRSGVALAAASLLVLLSAAPGFAQAAAAPAAPAQPAAQAPAAPAPPAVTFNEAAGALVIQIKGDRAADFEWALAKIKDALNKSENPVHKQQAAGLKAYKNPEAIPQTGAFLYVLMVNPTVPDADYSITTLSNVAYKALTAEEQQEFHKRISGAFAGPIARWQLSLVSDFAK